MYAEMLQFYVCLLTKKDEKYLIAEECGGEIDTEQFLNLHQKATEEKYGFYL